MKTKNYISIKTKTCLNESNSLYDNYSNEYKETVVKALDSFVIAKRKDGSCFFATSSSVDGKPLLSVVKIDREYFIDNCFENNLNNCFTNLINSNWMPVRYSNQNQPFKNCHKLFEGDVIKIGRLIFKVKQLINGNSEKEKVNMHSIIPSLHDQLDRFHPKGIKDSSKIQPTVKSNSFNGNYNPSFEKNTQANIKEVSYFDGETLDQSISFDKTTYSCRICLSSECNPEDPLISPCSCSGTMQYIHLKCVREWLKSKMKLKRYSSYTTMTWKDISCELCKTNFPDRVVLNKDCRAEEKCHLNSFRILDLISIEDEEIDYPYFILDYVNTGNDIDDTSKLLIIVKMNKKSLIVGRGAEADVNFSDLSISRKHSLFRLSNKNEIYITDEESKFGTLILQQSPIQIDRLKSQTYCIQNRKTMIFLNKRSTNNYLCCFKKKVINLHYGVNYFNNIHTFPQYFTRFVKYDIKSDFNSSNSKPECNEVFNNNSFYSSREIKQSIKLLGEQYSCLN